MARYELDLTQAQAALKQADDVAKLLKKSLREISQEFQAVGKTNVDATGKLVGYSSALEKRGVQSLKDFKREQRDQNFITREGTQAITNMVFALGFLSQGQKGASNTTKNVTTALLAGVAAQNAMEFSMFSVGRAGAKMGGAIGKVATSLSQYGGVIGIVVGVGASLFTLFDRSAEKAETAAKMLERYNKAAENFIKGIDKAQVEAAMKKNQAIVDATKALIAAKEEQLKKDREDLHVRALQGQATEKELKAIKEKEKGIEFNKQELGVFQGWVDQYKLYLEALQNVEDVKTREAGSRTEHIRDLYAEFGVLEMVTKSWEEVLSARIRANSKPTKATELDRVENLMPVMFTVSGYIDQIHEDEKKFLGALREEFSILQQGMSMLGLESDSMMSRLMNAVQFAIQLAQKLNAISAAKAKGEATGGLGFLGPIGSILGIFGSFLGRQSGGWTGPGPANRPAGIVHADEIVFEKSIVQRNRAELMSLRHSLQSGRSLRDAIAASSGAGGMRTEIRTRTLERKLDAVVLAIERMPARLSFTPRGIARVVDKDRRRGDARRFG